ncbi:MAG TPA: MogA/MoaB family molybdenum cofactor biosynthesis protein [Terracidiphilus sp.]|jgi:molybdenum cofactor synthesis domain-containing protein|nr:MogA/MoaB family molybdenum cofactor biosynthesis protein [Terracidiphilus sp.]
MFIAVLTVSDRCARGAATDTAGPAVVSLVREAWPKAEVQTALVADEPEEILRRLAAWQGQAADLILTVGGTGLGPRDNTPEATRRFIDREAPGIAEAMRAAGAEKNPMAWLSRGVAGLKAQALIVNLPGSLRGAQQSLTAILPLLRHGLETMAGTESHD